MCLLLNEAFHLCRSSAPHSQSPFLLACSYLARTRLPGNEDGLRPMVLLLAGGADGFHHGPVGGVGDGVHVRGQGPRGLEPLGTEEALCCFNIGLVQLW